MKTILKNYHDTLSELNKIDQQDTVIRQFSAISSVSSYLFSFLFLVRFLIIVVSVKGMSDSQSISSELAEPYLNYSRLQGDVEIVGIF